MDALILARSTRVSSTSPCSARPWKSLVPPPRMRNGVWSAAAARTRSVIGAREKSIRAS